MHRQDGFTLIEVTIVMVILGLLLGGVLKGQELVMSARVRNLIGQQDGIKAAFFGFQDRFRSLPGDYSSASKTFKCASGVACLNGNGNGVIEADAIGATQGSSQSEVHEELLAWMHLTSAGFLNGNFAMISGESGANDMNSPRNAYNTYLQIIYDGNYADARIGGKRHNLKTGSGIPVEIVAEVDRKVDDGNALQGAYRYSVYAAGSAVAPPAPTSVYTLGQCAGTSGAWFVVQGETNCGAASLL